MAVGANADRPLIRDNGYYAAQSRHSQISSSDICATWLTFPATPRNTSPKSDISFGGRLRTRGLGYLGPENPDQLGCSPL